MLTSKQRAELRAQANGLEVTLIIGKEGITGSLIDSAVELLDAKELIKGRVLETAGLTAREASDQICAAIGAEGVQCVGSKFILYRKSKKLEARRNAQIARERAAKKVNPVREGIKKRRAKAKRERDRKDEFFRQQREKERKENI